MKNAPGPLGDDKKKTSRAKRKDDSQMRNESNVPRRKIPPFDRRRRWFAGDRKNVKCRLHPNDSMTDLQMCSASNGKPSSHSYIWNTTPESDRKCQQKFDISTRILKTDKIHNSQGTSRTTVRNQARSWLPFSLVVRSTSTVYGDGGWLQQNVPVPSSLFASYLRTSILWLSNIGSYYCNLATSSLSGMLMKRRS